MIEIALLCQSDWMFSPPDSSFTSPEKAFNSMIILYVVGSVVSLLVFGVIGICLYKFVKKATPDVVRELRNITVAPPLAPAPHVSLPPPVIWEADAPTMEKFFREIAEEKPVRFTAPDLYSFTSNYSTRLGSGGFGEVYKGQFPNGVNIAVKVLKKSSDKRAEEQFMAEVGSICRTYHINLVRLYGFCYDHFMSALVFEYLENGSLDKYLFDRKQAMEWEKLHDIAIGTARGLAYLHEECQQRIIHYDIKPANILLDSNFFPKVGDFGLAKLCNRDNTHVSMSGFRGTFGYSAPEFFLTNYRVSHKCDVYSFGIVLFEIVGRKRNAGVTDSGNPDWFPEKVWDAFEKGVLDELVVGCGIGEGDREKASRACVVALWCVQDAPDERPRMSAVVKMLEGGVDIVAPPKPFQYLNPMRMGSTSGSSGSSEQTKSGSSQNSTATDTNSRWYRNTTTIMRKYEIQMASS
ncbi:rust resistance kinase Lr10-like isoform X2 [Cucurbita moschata]|uniref:Rust resistance kinase Lr10-like isoform X1 n=2 Tax=Cucurbita moschata TaxID=3662 RepID=A0A6J1FNM6_CUCMO|nr:rust resistance kinase Lr10-like isoform X1 [Cucurbita moschata]XP_022940203.1 rust resistance kinase Lr10-like isoform X2 [Cucurbita moschata]